MINIKYKTLKNGLRIVGDEVPYVHSVSLGVWINTGSRMEDESNFGIAHFIEHMLFKGTKNRSAKKISNDIDYYGGNINAFTTQDNTCYHVKMPYNHIERGIEVLSDIIKNSVFDDDDIKKEKSVISEEIKMYNDSPEDYLYEKLLNVTYNNKGAGRSILGTEESVNNINRDKIVDFFYNNYLPNNSVVVVSGNFDFDEITMLIEGYFGDWKSGNVLGVREGQEFLPVDFVENRDDEQSNIAILFKSLMDENYKDFVSIKILGNIFGNSPSSRLFQKIREEKGLTYSIYSADNFYVNGSEFGIFASVATENLLEVYKLILEEIELIKREYVSDFELNFAKEQYKGSAMMNVEDTEDRMLLIGEYEINGQRLKNIEEVVEYVDSIDIDYMRNVIDIIFSNPMSIGITGRNVEPIMKLR
ncbi:pitrilysin family protein [Peptostreptococcus porci]|uniref:M16 family metallopeptidase n=1 Tax=Peptostreptococcus porci TaxID=2652282 RepID=UPI002A9204A4|nr:pitrilysin family protein [Peptostreptococcus porci]MDY6231014.1 pitrilysin family protein [Peptostreptococcus porci]